MSFRLPTTVSRDLFFAALALQGQLVSRRALRAALHTWIADFHRPLADILTEQGSLRPDARQRLDQALANHAGLDGEAPPDGDANVQRRATLRRLVELCHAVSLSYLLTELRADSVTVRRPQLESTPAAATVGGLSASGGTVRASSPANSATLAGANERPWAYRGAAPSAAKQLLNPDQGDATFDAPEHVTDVYVLGNVLYTLLTGKQAFEGQDQAEVSERVRQGDFWPPRAIEPAVPYGLEAICLKAMARNGQDRYASPHAFADDLESWLAGDPVRACPESVPRRLARAVGRHRMAAALVILLLIVGVAAAAIKLTGDPRQWFPLHSAEERAAIESSFHQEVNERKHAGREWLRTRDVLSRLLNDLLNEWTANGTGLTAQQLQIVADTLGSYRSFLPDVSEQPERQASVADANFHIGLLSWRLGMNRQAVIAFRQSIDQLQDLAKRVPGDSWFPDELARAHLYIAIIEHAAHQTEAAEQEYRAAIAAYQYLADRVPANLDFPPGLAAAHVRLGVLLGENGRAPEGDKETREARAIYERLVSLAHRGPLSLQEVITTKAALAVVVAADGQQPRMEPLLDEALAGESRRLAQQPHDADYENNLASVLARAAAVAVGQKDYAAARKFLDQAWPHHRAALAMDASNSRYCSSFRSSILLSGDLQIQVGRYADAAVTADELQKAAVDAAVDYYNAACLLARSAMLALVDPERSEEQRHQQERAYADRAMQALRKAVAAGFRDRNHLEDDPDLQALHERADFRKLAASMGAVGKSPPRFTLSR